MDNKCCEQLITKVTNIPGLVSYGQHLPDWTIELFSNSAEQFSRARTSKFIHNQIQTLTNINYLEDIDKVKEKGQDIYDAKFGLASIPLRRVRQKGWSDLEKRPFDRWIWCHQERKRLQAEVANYSTNDSLTIQAQQSKNKLKYICFCDQSVEELLERLQATQVQLQQILINLLSNAIAVPDRSKVLT